FFAGLKFDYRALWNRHVGARVIWVPPHPRLAHFDLEDAKVAQLDFPSLRHGFCNVIEGLLNHVQHDLLHEARFSADSHDEVSFSNRGIEFQLCRKFPDLLSPVYTSTPERPRPNYGCKFLLYR